MNDYIINPMWFYWLSVVDGLNLVIVVTSVILGIGLLVAVMIGYVEGFGYDDESNKRGWTIVKRLGILLAVLILIGIFTPSKQTLIEMMIAKYATVSNTELAIDGVKEAVDYVINAIKAAK